MPFRNYKVLFRRISEGQIRTIYPININPVNVSSLKISNYVKSYSLLKINCDENESGLITNRNEKLAHIPNVWRLLESSNYVALSEGYENVFYMIADKTNISNFWQNGNSDLAICFKFNLRITQTSIKNSELTVDIIKSEKIKKIQLNIKSGRWSRSGNYSARFRHPEKIVNGDKKISVKIPLKDVLPDDRVEIFLILDELHGQIVQELKMDVPLEHPMEPFAKVFNRFYNHDEFKNALLNPSEMDDDIFL